MKKRILALFLSLALVLCCIPNVVHAEEETTDYIEIRTAKDLYKVRSDLTANYKLMNDIDLTEDTAPGGAYDFNGCGWNPIGSNNTYSDTPFTGVFDGQGHTIKGLSIRLTKYDNDSYYYIGLFANNEGTIKNLKIDHFNVDFDSSCKGIRVGTVAAVNNGTIQSVFANDLYYDIKRDYSYGEVEGVHTSNYNFVGGIAGLNNANILDSSVDGTILRKTESASYDIKYVVLLTTYLYISGIACNNSPASEIKRCSASIRLEWSNKTVAHGNESGGGCFAGISYSKTDGGTIEDSYSNFESPSGGIYGSITNNGNMKNCYTTGINVVQSTGTAENCYYVIGNGKGGTGWVGLNDNQMQDPDSFEGFDFENTWRMSEETVYKYPQLRSIRNGVTKVEIISEPTNEIVVGTDLKYEGAVARIYREDGTTEDVELTPENTEGGDTKTTGKKTVTYSYRGASASFDIDVVPVKITELEIKSLPTKTEYVTGQAFSSDGLVINAKYNNGTVTKCNDYYLDSDELDITTAGEKTLTASYNGVKVSFNVTYIAKQITDLKLTQAPDKTTYDEGQAFDPTGMVVTAYYNDDTSAEVTDYSVGVMTGYGDVKIPVSFEGKTVYASVYIRKLVKELSLEQNVLNLYETDEAELKIMAVPEDADNQDFVWTSSNDDVVTVDKTGKVTAVSEGKAEVTVTIENYPGLSCTCEVNVTAIKPVSLSIVQMPTEVNYLEGENFISDGLIVNLNYNSGKSVVCSDYSLGNVDTSVGKKTVTLTYGDISTQFTVNYYEKKALSISVTTPPTKTEYKERDSFDASGMVVEAEYPGGIKRTVTDYSFDEEVSLGQKSVKITFDGCEAEVPVTVTELKGMQELIELIKEKGSVTTTRGKITLTSDGLVDFAYDDKVHWKIHQDGTKVENGLTTTAYYGNLKITVDNQTYYIGKEFGLVNLMDRKGIEYEKRMHNLMMNAFASWALDLENKYDIAIEKCGFDSIYSDIIEEPAKDPDEEKELEKLVTILKKKNIVFYIGDNNELKCTISFDSNTHRILYLISQPSDVMETRVYFYYDVETLNHDIVVYCDTDFYSVNNYYYLKTSVNTALYNFDELAFSPYKTDVPATIFDSHAELFTTLKRLASSTFQLMISNLVLKLNQLYRIDFSKCGFNSLPSLMCKEHIWDSGTIKKYPTFFEEGQREFTCTKCGETKVESIPRMKAGWNTFEGRKYYYSKEGVRYEGLKSIEGKKYYFTKDGILQTGIQIINGKRYYFGSDGAMQTGIQTIGGKQYYFGSDGAMQTGMQTIGGKKYYFGSDGAMATGMQTIGGKKYYFGTDGAMKTGLQTVGGKTYYFGGDGKVPNGWKKVGSKWYYFKAGVMQTGWQKINKKWYYFKAGVMVSGWQKLGGKWYFFKSDGSMAANEWCKGYWLNKNGSWTYRKKATWKKDKTGWWFGCTGWYAKNQWQKIDGKWYYFDRKGYIVTGSRKIGSKTYKFNSSGVCLNP